MKRTNKFKKASLLGIAAHLANLSRILLAAPFRLRQPAHTHSRLGAVLTKTRKSTPDSAMEPRLKATGSAMLMMPMVAHQESFGQYRQAMNTTVNHCSLLSNIAVAFAVQQH